MIPRPKGEPGRGGNGGFNIRDAMGLENDKHRYNRLRVRFNF